MIKRRDIITTPRVEEMRREKRRARILRIVIIAILIIVVGAGLVLLSRIRPILIDTVVVTGARVIEPTAIEASVRSNITGAHLYLFPKRNALIYPKRKILRQLRETFPRIETVTITQNGFQELDVTISEREGKYLWCGNVFPEPVGAHCYFMDHTGFIFTEAPYFSGTVYFKWYGGGKGDQPIGMTAFSPEIVTPLVSFIESVEDLGAKPYALVAVDAHTYELYLERTGDVGPKIILSTKDDLVKIFDNLSSAFTTDSFREVIKNKFAGISYIDLRYENKVYYK